MRLISAAVSVYAVTLIAGQVHGADGAAPAAAPAGEDRPTGIGFEIGLDWHFPRSAPMAKGQGQYLAFDFDLGSVRVGYRYEKADYSSFANDDGGAGTGAEVEYAVQIHELRIMKPVYDEHIQVGLGFGMAQVHATLPINPGGGPTGTMFDRLAPTADVFVMLAPITGGRRVHAAFNVILGYRFLRIAPADPDQAGGDYARDLVDMSGLHLGASVSASF